MFYGMIQFNVWILEVHNPFFYDYLKFFFCYILLSCYINYDVFLMITRRKTLYKYDDWYLGIIHIHTDIFFRFFYDLS